MQSLIVAAVVVLCCFIAGITAYAPDTAMQFDDNVRSQFRDSGISAAQRHLSGQPGPFAFSANPLGSFRSQLVDDKQRQSIENRAREIQSVQQPDAQDELREHLRRKLHPSLASSAGVGAGFGSEIPLCVDGAGVLNSGNLFTAWFGGVGDLGKYYACEDSSVTKHCSMELKLVCVSEDKNITEYPYELFCNGNYMINSVGVCYNTTMCSEWNLTESLMLWSLEHAPISNYTFLPICLALEEAYRVPGHPMTNGLPGCDRRYSFVYMSPWCDSKTPLGKDHKDDDDTKAVKVCTSILLCVAAVSTFIGMCKRLLKQCKIDFNEDNDGSVAGSAESVRLMSARGGGDDDDGSKKLTSSAAGAPERSPYLADQQSPYVKELNSNGSGGDLYTSQLADIDYTGGRNAASATNPPDESCCDSCVAAIPGYASAFFDAFDVISGLVEFADVPKRSLPTGFFDGLRVIAMVLVIAGHVVYFPKQFSSFYNMVELKAFLQSYQSVTIFPALLAVDTFFFMSGFLAMHLLTRTLDAGKASASAISKLPIIIMTYVNRYLRLTPSMVFVIAIATWVLPTTVEGPLSRVYTQSADFMHCKTKLWATALYYANKDMSKYMCAPWFWYLMCDMQIFLFLPAFAYICWALRDRVPNYVMPIILFCTIGFLYGWAIHQHPISGEFVDDEGQPLFGYGRAVDRATPYAIGVFAAMLGAMPDVIDYLKSSMKLCYFLNLLSLGILVMIWNLTWKMQELFYVDTADFTEAWQYGGNAAYFLWGWPLLLVTLTSLAGFNSFVTRFLSHPFFSVVGKLTYGQYLTHPIVMNYMYAEDTHFASWQNFKYYVHIGGVMAVATLASLVLFLVIDRPVGKFCTWLGQLVGAKKKKGGGGASKKSSKF